jgi:hypothetical protein
MEFENNKKIKKFISDSQRNQILDFVYSLQSQTNLSNVHIQNVAEELKGKVLMFDLSKTDLSKKLSEFQSDNNISEIELPDYIAEIKTKISKSLSIKDNDVFLQILDSQRGGKIIPHYDTAFKNYITYKCNICVLGEPYKLFVEDSVIEVEEKDLYSFESSLYKHWTEPFSSRRIILSFGFIVPIWEMNRNENDFRIRFSNRLIKKFQEVRL